MVLLFGRRGWGEPRQAPTGDQALVEDRIRLPQQNTSKNLKSSLGSCPGRGGASPHKAGVHSPLAQSIQPEQLTVHQCLVERQMMAPCRT